MLDFSHKAALNYGIGVTTIGGAGGFNRRYRMGLLDPRWVCYKVAEEL